MLLRTSGSASGGRLGVSGGSRSGAGTLSRRSGSDNGGRLGVGGGRRSGDVVGERLIEAGRLILLHPLIGGYEEPRGPYPEIVLGLARAGVLILALCWLFVRWVPQRKLQKWDGALYGRY